MNNVKGWNCLVTLNDKIQDQGNNKTLSTPCADVKINLLK